MKPKQCGNCTFWNRENATSHNQSGLIKLAAKCLAPIPHSIIWEIKTVMAFDEGEACPIYVERQDDGDSPDESGYTRDDEDWFF